jgi:hypothetical protein
METPAILSTHVVAAAVVATVLADRVTDPGDGCPLVALAACGETVVVHLSAQAHHDAGLLLPIDGRPTLG